MKIVKNKKGDASAEPVNKIVKWIILIFLIVFVILWYSGMGNTIISVITDILK
jgi:hypothetical protein